MEFQQNLWMDFITYVSKLFRFSANQTFFRIKKDNVSSINQHTLLTFLECLGGRLCKDRLSDILNQYFLGEFGFFIFKSGGIILKSSGEC